MKEESLKGRFEDGILVKDDKCAEGEERKRFLTEKDITGNKNVIYTFLSGEDSD